MAPKRGFGVGAIPPPKKKKVEQAIVIEIEINNHVYSHNLDEMLTLDWDKVLRSFDPSSVEFHLGQCARFHAMMSVAWSESLEQKMLADLDLEVWYGDQILDSESEIRTHRKMHDIGSTGITKEQCLAQVLSKPARRELYVEYKSDLAGWTRKEAVTRSLMRNLENFGMHLQSILKHRDQEKSMSREL